MVCNIILNLDNILINNYVLGESVEENANLVIRLLIRRPECLGPALRGEGEGLLRAIIDANKVPHFLQPIYFYNYVNKLQKYFRCQKE